MSLSADQSRAPSASLYVGDLHPDVTESDIADVFGELVASIRLCRDTVTQQSLKYAYVNYVNAEEASKAISNFNGKIIKGKAIRVCYSERDPTKRRSGEANICVKNLTDSEDIAKKLRAAFTSFGNIVSSKVSYDNTGKMLGYGYINFDKKEEANVAIEAANNKQVLIDGVPVTAESYVPRSSNAGPSNSFTNVYVKNIPTTWTNTDISQYFSKFGTVTSGVVSGAQGENAGFGYVNFETTDAANEAIKAVNDAVIDGKKLFASRHLKKSDRERQRRETMEQKKHDKYQKYASCNLYIKRLPADITEEQIKETFGAFGKIFSSKVNLSADGVATGVAYVCYESAEDASKAIVEMNNRPFNGKPLYVALHQPKQYRDAHRMTRRNPHINMRPYHPFVYYPFPPIGAAAPQYGFPRRFNNRGGPRNQNNKTRRPRRHHDNQGKQGAKSISLLDEVKQIPEEEQKQFLGEKLYVKVEQLAGEDFAPKITGMLLEMGIEDVVTLCENQTELKNKVEEAQLVLKGSATKGDEEATEVESA